MKKRMVWGAWAALLAAAQLPACGTDDPVVAPSEPPVSDTVAADLVFVPDLPPSDVTAADAEAETVDAAGDATVTAPALTAAASWNLLAQADLPPGDWRAITARPDGRVAVWSADSAQDLDGKGQTGAHIWTKVKNSDGTVMVAGRNFQDCAVIGGRRVMLFDAQFTMLGQLDMAEAWTPTTPAPRGDGSCAVGFVRPTSFGVVVIAKGAKAQWTQWSNTQKLEHFAATAHPLAGWWLLGHVPATAAAPGGLFGAAHWRGEAKLPYFMTDTSPGADVQLDEVRGGAPGLANHHFSLPAGAAAGGLLPLRGWTPSLDGGWMLGAGPATADPNLPRPFSTAGGHTTNGATASQVSRWTAAVRADGVGHSLMALTDRSDDGTATGGAPATLTAVRRFELTWLAADGGAIASHLLCRREKRQGGSAEPTVVQDLAPGLVDCAMADAVEARPGVVAVLAPGKSAQQVVWLQPTRALETDEDAQAVARLGCQSAGDCPRAAACSEVGCDTVHQVCQLTATVDAASCQGGTTCAESGSCQAGACSAGVACATAAPKPETLACGDDPPGSATFDLGATGSIERYTCGNGLWSGGEKVVQIAVAAPAMVAVTGSGGGPITVVRSPALSSGEWAASSCLDAGGSVQFFAKTAGTYSVIVDSRGADKVTVTAACTPLDCGDKVCAGWPGEDCASCPGDCGKCKPTCADGLPSASCGLPCQSCVCAFKPACCTGPWGPDCAAACTACANQKCGNGVCEWHEADSGCAADCPAITLAK